MNKTKNWFQRQKFTFNGVAILSALIGAIVTISANFGELRQSVKVNSEGVKVISESVKAISESVVKNSESIRQNSQDIKDLGKTTSDLRQTVAELVGYIKSNEPRVKK